MSLATHKLQSLLTNPETSTRAITSAYLARKRAEREGVLHTLERESTVRKKPDTNFLNNVLIQTLSSYKKEHDPYQSIPRPPSDSAPSKKESDDAPSVRVGPRRCRGRGKRKADGSILRGNGDPDEDNDDDDVWDRLGPSGKQEKASPRHVARDRTDDSSSSGLTFRNGERSSSGNTTHQRRTVKLAFDYKTGELVDAKDRDRRKRGTDSNEDKDEERRRKKRKKRRKMKERKSNGSDGDSDSGDEDERRRRKKQRRSGREEEGQTKKRLDEEEENKKHKEKKKKKAKKKRREEVK
eukprot:TRINITY_DN463_c0_g1_i1.p1 TRINITY_DN463_c0_g1~~TRINITY_DN463_c0_g1_i1.p1  ORF type:complete len:296 (+),score=74.30 TRINITY_DN463_c0_g1_i1:143-1030(+)